MTTSQRVGELAEMILSQAGKNKAWPACDYVRKYKASKPSIRSALAILIERGDFATWVDGRSRVYGLPIRRDAPAELFAPRVFRELKISREMQASIDRIKELHLYPSIG